MQDLRVTPVQAALIWEDPAANRAHFDRLLQELPGRTDVVVLPEMFTTGFTMNPAPVAEPMDGPTVAWMREQAGRLDAVVTGSLVIEENGAYHNRLVWMRPDGSYDTYDKRHRFAMAGEHEHYARGNERLVTVWRGWRVCPLICYDLRFPVWARNDDSYDLLIYTANWPDRRAYDWLTLLRARAIENQCYVVGVNRTGTDAGGHHYRGDSCVVDPGWRRMLWHAAHEPALATVTLAGSHLAQVRESLPFLRDRDSFTVG